LLASGFKVDKKLQPAAKNVGCINTSNNKGVNVYTCHQNYRMGSCGNSQAASSTAGPDPVDSHRLCPYFYNFAFTNDYVYSNDYYACSSARILKNTTSAVKMGYLADFNR